MTVGMGRHAHLPASEEAVAATRVVLALTAAVGGMAGAISLAAGGPIGWIVVPVAALLLAGIGHSRQVAAACGAVVWAGLLPQAHAEAMLGPLLMVVACVAIAVGPERLAAIVARDFRGDRADESQASVGWIEEV